jgi:hypothetical protein
VLEASRDMAEEAESAPKRWHGRLLDAATQHEWLTVQDLQWLLYFKVWDMRIFFIGSDIVTKIN